MYNWSVTCLRVRLLMLLKDSIVLTWYTVYFKDSPLFQHYSCTHTERPYLVLLSRVLHVVYGMTYSVISYWYDGICYSRILIFTDKTECSGELKRFNKSIWPSLMILNLWPDVPCSVNLWLHQHRWVHNGYIQFHRQH